MNLQDVGRIALQQGLDQDAAYAAMAIAQTEGGLNGAVGDNGHSYGPFQFYSGGQLKNFAAYLKVPMAQAGQIAMYQPEMAVRWALGPGGYLGDTLRNAQRQGISGSDLATYAQRHGQVSVSPERAGQNYDILFGGGKGSAPQTTAALSGGVDQPFTPYRADQPPAWQGMSGGGPFVPYRADSAPAASGGGFVPYRADSTDQSAASVGSSKPVSQFGDAQLTPAEASAACGPAAAIRFAQRYGRNPTLREATDLAKQVGWSAGKGMAGLGSEKALMDKLGIPTRQVGADIQAMGTEAQTGNPITISTPGHYFTADGYNPQTGAFHVGQSGLDLKGGSEWMTPAQMQGMQAAGPIQGALFADNPQVQSNSTASTPFTPYRADQQGTSTSTSPTQHFVPYRADQQSSATSFTPVRADRMAPGSTPQDQAGTWGDLVFRPERDANTPSSPYSVRVGPYTWADPIPNAAPNNGKPIPMTPLSAPSSPGWDSVLNQVDFAA